MRRGLPRWIQFSMAAALLIGSSPILLAASVAIVTTSKGTLLFRQTRIGKKGTPFVLLKLRTMSSSEGSEITIAGDRRVTRVGRFLRRFKVDELPQLWNVLRGEMELVGPRPEVPQYVDANAPLWQEILESAPGMTDPVSLSLRNEELLLSAAGDPLNFYRDELLPFKLKKSAEYLRSRTMGSDLRVLVQTALVPLGLGPPPVTSIARACDQPEGHSRAGA